ncbi:hypothetical protein Tsubulata_003600 [Turnera subulata]|uniref:Smr domain-containing protein n=1 Tax=Turnera subulata TaxID=218843 RepID=A0A9Q0FQQ5_9ROSI|nr:hypothetical protein Tsubulata_003600 [Turnera subulata]
MKQQTKKKKRRPSRAPKPPARAAPHSPSSSSPTDQPPPPPPPQTGDEQQGFQLREHEELQHEGSDAVHALMEAFDSISVEDASSALKEANGDLDKAAMILANPADCSDDPSTSSVSSGLTGFDSTSGAGSSSSSSSSGSSSGSSLGSSEGSVEGSLARGKGFRGGNKQKKVLAVTGTVSAVLGKEYVKKATPRRESVKGREFCREEAEQFLCSMLGDDCELSLAVVRDVLCQCGYNVDKALDVLLDLSATSGEQSRNAKCFNGPANYQEDNGFPVDRSDNLTDGASDCASLSSESELHDTVWGFACRDYLQALTNLQSPSQHNSKKNESDLPQEVLESLFNIPKCSEHEPNTMNWRNVVKKVQSLGPRVDVLTSSDASAVQDPRAKSNEYNLFRRSASELWESRNSYYQKAAAAYSKGEREYAAYLSDQGRIQTQLAREADDRASQNIFKARNKGIENVVTIDMHGQHVKPAMRLLKIHLLFGTYVHSIQALRVITGCGSHGLGKSKLKQSVIQLLEKEGIEWREENRGVVLIKLDGYKHYSFLDADSDTD